MSALATRRSLLSNKPAVTVTPPEESPAVEPSLGERVRLEMEQVGKRQMIISTKSTGITPSLN